MGGASLVESISGYTTIKSPCSGTSFYDVTKQCPNLPTMFLCCHLITYTPNENYKWTHQNALCRIHMPNAYSQEAAGDQQHWEVIKHEKKVKPVYLKNSKYTMLVMKSKSLKSVDREGFHNRRDPRGPFCYKCLSWLSAATQSVYLLCVPWRCDFCAHAWNDIIVAQTFKGPKIWNPGRIPGEEGSIGGEVTVLCWTTPFAGTSVIMYLYAVHTNTLWLKPAGGGYFFLLFILWTLLPI